MLAGKARDSLQEESRIAHVSYPRDCSGCVVARRFYVDACQQPFHPPAAAVCRDLAHHALCWRPQDRLKQAYPENIEAEPKARLQMLLQCCGNYWWATGCGAGNTGGITAASAGEVSSSSTGSFSSSAICSTSSICSTKCSFMSVFSNSGISAISLRLSSGAITS